MCCLVPSSVLDVSYQNISSTSILVSWTPPLHPNGRITHYTVYGLNLHNNKALHWATENTTILLSGKLHVLRTHMHSLSHLLFLSNFLQVVTMQVTSLVVCFLCSVVEGLDKYTGYKLRVAASTAVGESSLSDEDDIFVYTLEDGVC